MSLRRALGVTMMLLGGALLLALFVAMSHRHPFGTHLALLVGIPSVLLCLVGGVILLVEGERLREADDDGPS